VEASFSDTFVMNSCGIWGYFCLCRHGNGLAN